MRRSRTNVPTSSTSTSTSNSSSSGSSNVSDSKNSLTPPQDNHNLGFLEEEEEDDANLASGSYQFTQSLKLPRPDAKHVQKISSTATKMLLPSPKTGLASAPGSEGQYMGKLPASVFGDTDSELSEFDLSEAEDGGEHMWNNIHPDQNRDGLEPPPVGNENWEGGAEEDDRDVVMDGRSLRMEQLEDENAVEDNDEDDDYEPSISKKSRKTGAKQSRIPKVGRQRDYSAGIPKNLGGDMKVRAQHAGEEINSIVASLTGRGKGRGSPNDALSLERNTELATNVVRLMLKLQWVDMECIKKKKTATNRLRFLPKLEKCLVRPDLRRLLIDENLLIAFKAWLEPQRDGFLPHYQIRSVLFSHLLKLPIELDDLIDSKIGYVANFYSRTAAENSEVKKMARACVDRWSRLLAQGRDGYGNTGHNIVNVDLKRVRARPVLQPAYQAPTDDPRNVLDAAGRLGTIGRYVKDSRKNLNGGDTQSPNTITAPRVRNYIPAHVPNAYHVRPADNIPRDGMRNSRRKNTSEIEMTIKRLRTSLRK